MYYQLHRVPWTARRSNQSILEEINPEYSLEGLMLKLKVQYFDHLIQRADSLEKTLMLGKTEGQRRGQQKIIWLDSITDPVDMSLSKFQEIKKDRAALGTAVHGVPKSQTWLSDWTSTNFHDIGDLGSYLFFHSKNKCHPQSSTAIFLVCHWILAWPVNCVVSLLLYLELHPCMLPN